MSFWQSDFVLIVRVFSVCKVVPECNLRESVLHAGAVVLQRIRHQRVHRGGVRVPVGQPREIDTDFGTGGFQAGRGAALRRRVRVLGRALFRRVRAEEKGPP